MLLQGELGMHLHFGLNQAVHIPVLAVNVFLACFRQLQIPVAAAQARMLVRRLPSCQSAVEHALQTITTPSALSVSCLALASQFFSHSHSLFVRLSHFCASYFSSFFSIHPSHGLMKRRLGEQHGLFVCLTFFI